MPRRLPVSPVWWCLFAACGPAPADLLLVNARVYTLDWPEPTLDGAPSEAAPFDPTTGWRPDAEAVAIADGRIQFVGTTTAADRLRGSATVVRDLHGATVLPGFVDSHTHVAALGENLSRVDLTGARDPAEAIARVVAAHPSPAPDRWLIGYGWDEGAWANRYPDGTALSRAFPNNPVVMLSRHGFAVWGNDAAFHAAGIDATTPDPPGGTIRRDPNHTPRGVVLNRAGPLLLNAIPAPDARQRMAYFHVGLVAMGEAGYVSVHEAGLDAAAMEAIEALARGDDLPLRVYAMLSARDSTLIDEWIGRGPDGDVDSRLRTRAVKAYYDAALGSRGAQLLDDYRDRPGHRGTAGADYGFDEERVEAAIDAGFQAAIHAIGDAGNRAALDFLARVGERHPAARAGRHRIEHAQVVHPADLPRFGALGLVASMQPPHAVEDMPWAEDRLGPTRVRGAYAWRTLRRAGARLVFSSDLPGSNHDPFYGLHAAVTRRNEHLEQPDGWYPDQALRIEEAIRAYTAWAAYAAFTENETGVIAPGRWADLTVTDLDPFAVGETDPGRLLDGAVLLTVVGGTIVFDRAGDR